MGSARPTRRPVRARPPAWVHDRDEDLLERRLCDLGVSIADSPLEDRIEELYRNLERRGIRFRPHVWVSSEWFSPKGVPGIAVPFYLTHWRLVRLERAQMLECEGAERRECLMLLRHEAGHAIQHAYRLHRRRKWQQLFGPSSKPYPQYYRPSPASRRFVQHLRLYYAQSHPDEDFAETFAVWLQPRSHWKRRYAGWPALRKLLYVDELMEEIAGRAPLVRTKRVVDPIERLTQTLREYYEQKRSYYGVGQPEIYDRDLRRLFSDEPRHRKRERASTFLRRNRSRIRRLVSRWTGEHAYTLDQVLEEMIDRCRELDLRAVGAEGDLLAHFSVLLTVQTMKFQYRRRPWVAL